MRSKIVYLVFTILVSFCLLVGGISCRQSAEEKTVKVGALIALSGAASFWGIGCLNGLEIWVDDVNAAGGIEAGGQKYKVELFSYDDEFSVNRALEGAKKLVLEDKVNFIIGPYGVPTAVGPFLDEHEIPWFTVANNYVANRTYGMVINNPSPELACPTVAYVARTYPQAKTIAFAYQDDNSGMNHMIYTRAAAEIAGLETVYNKAFAFDTQNFSPVVAAILNTNPDILWMGDVYPPYTTAIWEQLKMKGFEGIIGGTSWDTESLVAKVGPEYMDARLGFGLYPRFDDPSLPEENKNYFDRYVARFGEDMWSPSSWQGIGFARAWAYGAKLAGSIDGRAVKNALKAADDVPTFFGPGGWYGTEVYGTDGLVFAKSAPIFRFVNGRESIVDYVSWFDWWENNGSYLVESLEKEGMLYYQR
ncbi:ABC transporter substrate-binding protein [Chloroflexota bacterium]